MAPRGRATTTFKKHSYVIKTDGGMRYFFLTPQQNGPPICCVKQGGKFQKAKFDVKDGACWVINHENVIQLIVHIIFNGGNSMENFGENSGKTPGKLWEHFRIFVCTNYIISIIFVHKCLYILFYFPCKVSKILWEVSGASIIIFYFV